MGDSHHEEAAPEKSKRNRRNRNRHKGAKPASPEAPAIVVPVKEETVKPKTADGGSRRSHSGKRQSSQKSSGGNGQKNTEAPAVKVQKVSVQATEAPEGGKSEKKSGKPRRRHYHSKKTSGKPASES